MTLAGVGHRYSLLRIHMRVSQPAMGGEIGGEEALNEHGRRRVALRDAAGGERQD
jgi:hypothetical protein